MKKKMISTLVAAAMALSAFAVPVAAEEAEPVTLTYWGWDSNYYQPVMEAYMESHPNVKFEATATEWGDMLTKAQQPSPSITATASAITVSGKTTVFAALPNEPR